MDQSNFLKRDANLRKIPDKGLSSSVLNPNFSMPAPKGEIK